jgi:hypothetical protein
LTLALGGALARAFADFLLELGTAREGKPGLRIIWVQLALAGTV